MGQIAHARRRFMQIIEDVAGDGGRTIILTEREGSYSRTLARAEVY